MGTQRKSAAATKGGAPRGAELIAEVVAAIEALGAGLPSDRMLDARRKRGAPNPKPKPMAPELLASLRLSSGRPLPQSLAAWLAYDGAWQPLDVDPVKKVLRPSTFKELLRRAMPTVAPSFEGLGDVLLPGGCHRVWIPSECSDSSVVFLYEPATGDDGEPPVVGLDFSDSGIVGLFACGFDVYMARVMQVCEGLPYALGAGPAPYADASRAALQRIISAAPKAIQKKLYVDEDVIAVGSLAVYDV